MWNQWHQSCFVTDHCTVLITSTYCFHNISHRRRYTLYYIKILNSLLFFMIAEMAKQLCNGRSRWSHHWPDWSDCLHCREIKILQKIWLIYKCPSYLNINQSVVTLIIDGDIKKYCCCFRCLLLMTSFVSLTCYLVSCHTDQSWNLIYEWNDFHFVHSQSYCQIIPNSPRFSNIIDIF